MKNNLIKLILAGSLALAGCAANRNSVIKNSIIDYGSLPRIPGVWYNISGDAFRYSDNGWIKFVVETQGEDFDETGESDPDLSRMGNCKSKLEFVATSKIWGRIGDGVGKARKKAYGKNYFEDEESMPITPPRQIAFGVGEDGKCYSYSALSKKVVVDSVSKTYGNDIGRYVKSWIERQSDFK